jgi:predicted transglutaminase-like cysteine proteinase
MYNKIISYLYEKTVNPNKIDSLTSENNALKVENKSLITQLYPNPKEKELNEKYPQTIVRYKRRETDDYYEIDVRDYFQLYDADIPIVSGKSDDEKAVNALKHVINNITYTPDKTTYGYSEYWAYPYQTMKRKKGDCEDGAILLANIMVKSGIPYWKVRITCGDVDDGKGNAGGHAFVVYYYEEGDYWVLLDWCYWENLKEISKRKDYKDENYYKDIWFSFNEKYAFRKNGKDGILNQNNNIY